MTELQRDKTFDPSGVSGTVQCGYDRAADMSTYPHHNSRRRQFVAGILFSAAFIVPPAVGIMLLEYEHSVLIVIALFFILQFSAFFVATNKLRESSHD